MEKIGGIILAGGKSSRMGTDKGLINYQGQPLVEHAIDLLKQSCAELIISTNQAGYAAYGFRLVEDVFPNSGPAGGLHASLLASNYDWNMVLSCDVPHVEADLLQLLLQRKSGVEAVIPQHKNGIEPLVALYHKSLAATFERNIEAGIFKMQRILNQAKVEFVAVDDWLERAPQCFRNLNRLEDL